MRHLYTNSYVSKKKKIYIYIYLFIYLFTQMEGERERTKGTKRETEREITYCEHLPVSRVVCAVVALLGCFVERCDRCISAHRRLESVPAFAV